MSEKEQEQAAVQLLEQTIQDIGPKLAERAREQLANEMVRSMGHSVSQVTHEFVQEWTRENLLPEIRAQLQAQKPQLIAMVVAGMHAACRQLAEALERKAAKNAARGWHLGAIIKELLD